MFGLGAGELLVIAIFALLFIGPKKLPELAKGLGKGIREFQKTKDQIMNEVHNPTPEDEAKSAEIADLELDESGNVIESEIVEKDPKTNQIDPSELTQVNSIKKEEKKS